MKDNRDLEQIFRMDGKAVFAEVMLSGLIYDKVLINFCSYDATRNAGSRSKAQIGIFLDIFDAEALAHDILSGKIALLGKRAREKAKANSSKYPEAVYESLGGTSGKRCPDGIPIARVFQIAPGMAQPWVFCAKQGKGHETKEGLIVLDAPEQTVRVPATDATLKKFAFALQTTVRLWEMTRFLPVIKPMMSQALARRQSVIDEAKAASAARNGAQYGVK